MYTLTELKQVYKKSAKIKNIKLSIKKKVGKITKFLLHC